MLASDFNRVWSRIKKATEEKNFTRRIYLRSYGHNLEITTEGPTSYAAGLIEHNGPPIQVCLSMEFGSLLENVTGEVEMEEDGRQLILGGALKGRVNTISSETLAHRSKPIEWVQIPPEVKEIVYAGDGWIHACDDILATTNRSRFAAYKLKHPLASNVMMFPSRVLTLVEDGSAMGANTNSLWLADSLIEVCFQTGIGNIAVCNYGYERNPLAENWCAVPTGLYDALQIASYFGEKGWLEYEKQQLRFTPIGSDLGMVETEVLKVTGEGSFRFPVSTQYLSDAVGNTHTGKLKRQPILVVQKHKTVQGIEVETLRIVGDDAQHFIPMDATLK